MCKNDANIETTLHTKSSSTLKRISLFIAFLVGAFALAIPILISELVGGWTRKYTSPVRFHPQRDIPNLSGKVAIVTGSNTGIGYHTALNLAMKGAHVIAAARSEVRGKDAIAKMEQEMKDNKSIQNGGKVTFLPLDLSSLDSVDRFASEFLSLQLPSLDILVLNAGVMKSPGSDFVGQNLTYGFETTRDGFETHIGVNHIAHAHLTNLLLDKLKASAPSRIVSVSSMSEMGGYEEGFRFQDWRPTNGKPESYEDGRAYGQSKLANLMWTEELAIRWNGTGVTAYSCHPGVIETELSRYMEKELESNNPLSILFFKIFSSGMFSAPDGALTQLHLATAPEDSLMNGQFYHPIGRLTPPYHPLGKNANLRSVLWDETQRAIQLRKKYSYVK